MPIDKDCIIKYGPIHPPSDVKNTVIECIQQGERVSRCRGSIMQTKKRISEVRISEEALTLNSVIDNSSTLVLMRDISKFDVSSTDRKSLKLKSSNYNIRIQFETIFERNVFMIMMYYWMKTEASLEKYSELFLDGSSQANHNSINSFEGQNTPSNEQVQLLEKQITKLKLENESLSREVSKSIIL